MSPIDRGLKNSGFRHLRYVDDIRIFCHSSLEAKQALLKLNGLLRNRGLNLQTAKTEILRADEARQRIDGITPVITSIHRQLSEELRKPGLHEDSYGTVTLDKLKRIAADPDSPAVEVLERAFHDYFSRSESKFDKTLFHFLLTRLGRVGSRIAAAYCLDILETRPEETEHVLRYLSWVGIDKREDDRIVRYTQSKEAIYDYQLFQIAKWYLGRDDYPKRLIRACRQWVFDLNRSTWLRTCCLLILGRVADAADLELIEGRYSEARTELEKADIVAALAKHERGRRNAFYGRVRGDGELVRRAVTRARARNSPS